MKDMLRDDDDTVFDIDDSDKEADNYSEDYY